MAIGGIGAIGAGLPGVGGVAGAAVPRGVGGAGSANFGEMIKQGLESVSNAEKGVDQVTQTMAAGGPAEIHDLMAASAKAQIQVDLLVQVRNRAVEAYQEIMRIQI